MTPLKAIRAKCVWCCNGQPREVSLCPAKGCPLHPWRKGRKPEDATKSALKTIREKCLSDCGGLAEVAGVKSCDVKDCPLWPFRLGTNPNISEATRAKQRQRASKKGAFCKSVADEQLSLPIDFEATASDTKAKDDPDFIFKVAEIFMQSAGPETQAMGRMMKMAGELSKKRKGLS